jgi:predicted DNA-binding transcriptional regulator AlpA
MSIRLLRLPQVCERTGWSESTVRRKVKQKILKPPVHPDGDGRVAGWPEPEIDAVLEAAIAARDARDAAPPRWSQQLAAARKMPRKAQRAKRARQAAEVS